MHFEIFIMCLLEFSNCIWRPFYNVYSNVQFKPTIDASFDLIDFYLNLLLNLEIIVSKCDISRPSAPNCLRLWKRYLGTNFTKTWATHGSNDIPPCNLHVFFSYLEIVTCSTSSRRYKIFWFGNLGLFPYLIYSPVYFGDAKKKLISTEKRQVP